MITQMQNLYINATVIYLYCFHHGLSLYAFIVPLATARGKIFGIKCQPVVKTI